MLMSGCGNIITEEIVGTTAISIDEAGNPVVVIAVCSGHINQVDVSGDQKGLKPDEPDPDVGSTLLSVDASDADFATSQVNLSRQRSQID
jgi:hypothetical protein